MMKCRYCSYWFKNKKGRDTHEGRIHKGVFKIQAYALPGGIYCDLCRFHTFNVLDLKKHRVRKHPEAPQMEIIGGVGCPFCHRIFKGISGLLIHMSIKHKGRPFPKKTKEKIGGFWCPHCLNKKHKTKLGLLYHIRQKHEDIYYDI